MQEEEKNIYCTDCTKSGYKTLLGKNVSARGVLKLWCKRCRKEINIEV